MLKQHQRGKRNKNIQVFDTCPLPAPSNPIHYINRYEAEVFLQFWAFKFGLFCVCVGGGWVFISDTQQAQKARDLPCRQKYCPCSFKAIYYYYRCKTFLKAEEEHANSICARDLNLTVVELNFAFSKMQFRGNWLKSKLNELWLIYFYSSWKWRGHLHIQLLLLLWWRIPHLLWNRWKHQKLPLWTLTFSQLRVCWMDSWLKSIFRSLGRWRWRGQLWWLLHIRWVLLMWYCFCRDSGL